MRQELNQTYGTGHLCKEGKRLANFRYDIGPTALLLTALPEREADRGYFANNNLTLELEDGQRLKLYDSCRGGIFKYEVSNSRSSLTQ